MSKVGRRWTERRHPLAAVALLLALSVAAVVVAASTGSWNTSAGLLGRYGSGPNSTGQTTGSVSGNFALLLPGFNRIVQLPGTVTARNEDGYSVTVAVPASGRFTADLKPGRYTFTGTSPEYSDGSGECYGASVLQVSAGGTYAETVTCPTR
jgi:hypothetical protein